MYEQKPVIGIAGGIGSGKSFISRLFGELGARVIHADEQVKNAYRDPDIRKTIVQWWGKSVFLDNGEVNRKRIAASVFSDPQQRRQLEALLHPWVNQDRRRQMAEAAADPVVKAFVLDTPLLYETGQDKECDAVVFVEAPIEMRQQRVFQERQWAPVDLVRRENFQWSLDKKRQIADYVVVNTADAEVARDQVRKIFSRILFALH